MRYVAIVFDCVVPHFARNHVIRRSADGAHAPRRPPGRRQGRLPTVWRRSDPGRGERPLSIDVDHDWFHDTCKRYGLDPTSFWHARDITASDRQIDLVERGQKRLYDDHISVRDIALPQAIVSTTSANSSHSPADFLS